MAALPTDSAPEPVVALPIVDSAPQPMAGLPIERGPEPSAPRLVDLGRGNAVAVECFDRDNAAAAASAAAAAAAKAAAAAAAAAAASAPEAKQTAIKAYGKFQNFVHDEQAPWHVNMLGLAAGVLVVLNGIFGLIDIFNVFGGLLTYIVNGYQVLFGVTTIVLELKPEYANATFTRVQHIQDYIHEWFHGLQLYWGKAGFYILQGMLTLLSSDILSFGSAVGVFMTLVGVVNLQLFWRHGKDAPGTAAPEDYIRIGA